MTTEFPTRSDFKPQNIVVLGTSRGGAKWAYTAEWKGKTSLHIREVYQDANEDYCPGKGISFPVDAVENLPGMILAVIEGFKAASAPKAAPAAAKTKKAA
ncbi:MULTISPECIES: transcriptional coactivator p15/PC4 family protein [unclassified Bradyrhizobium]|uniref:transcriptional coactivator p15/PC4 family protein n=1 Tax=unclassified Bradyrhizobium TaxID=2631580 RepID=UPI00339452DA